MRRLVVLMAGLVAGLLTFSLLTPTGSPQPAAAAAPSLEVTTEISGLSQPWDVQPLPDGSLLVTERSSKRLLRFAGGTLRSISYASNTVWAEGETGFMSLEVDPAFASNRRFYTCHGGFSRGTSGTRDVRVVSWTLSADSTRATASRVLVSGLPATSGRHGGCRLLIHTGGWMLVGTGDAAHGPNARNKNSLGGKVLRINRVTGAPVSGNPFMKAKNPNQRKLLSFGHRNVQGLAQRGGAVWSAEHGPARDDEINRLVRGGDYGWHPVPGYNEQRPMTDHGLPGTQRAAKWRSGSPTVAISGIAWVRGSQWGSLDGTLAAAALKGSRVLFMTFDSRDRLVRTETPDELRAFGRLRSVTPLPGGDLLVTTANGTDDRVLRVSPAG